MLVLVLFSLFTSILADPHYLSLPSIGSTTTVTVEVGSNLFLSSNDKATALANIKLTNGGNTVQANTLLNPYNADGSMIPWALTDATLTIVSTNDQNTTNQLTGYFYITTAAQAQDADFHVFKVHTTQTLSFKKSSTVVFMTIESARSDPAPIYQPYRNTLITNIVQKNTTLLRVYNDMPLANYKDRSDSASKLMFSNPIDFTPLDTTRSYYFFDNVEPIQFPQRILYLTVDDDITLTVSNDWQDQIIYNTTSVTTTGMITYHLFEVNTTVNFQINPANNRTVGYIISTYDLWSSIEYTFYSANANSNSVSHFETGNTVNNALFSTDLPATQLYGVPAELSVGIFYLQYFGIDGIPYPTTVGPSTLSTAPQAPSTTTTPAATTTSGVSSQSCSFIMFFIVSMLIQKI